MEKIYMPRYGPRGNIYEYFINMRWPYTGELTIAHISDLCFTSDDKSCFNRLRLIALAIDEQNPDVIIISGDIVNDAGDLKSTIFCKKIREVIKMLSGDRLVIIDKGNRDISTMNEMNKQWLPVDSKMLNEALATLSNVYFLDDVTNLYLKNNSKLASIGYEGLTHFDINFIGGDLPYEFYFKHNENMSAFEQHWNTKFKNNYTYFPNYAFNVLSMHAIRNFVRLYRNLGDEVKNLNLVLSGQHDRKRSLLLDNFFLSDSRFFNATSSLILDYQRNCIDMEDDTKVLISNYDNAVLKKYVEHMGWGIPPTVTFISLNSNNSIYSCRKKLLKVR